MSKNTNATIEGQENLLDNENSLNDGAATEQTKNIKPEAVKVMSRSEKLAAANSYYDEKITHTFPLTGNRDDEEIHVTYNGRNYIIRRGVSVTIPRGVLDIIETANRQKNELFRMQDANRVKEN